MAPINVARFSTLGKFIAGGICREMWRDDSTTVTITVRMDGREQRVPAYLGCRGEEELHALEETIDRLAGVIEWRKSNPVFKERQMVVGRFLGHYETGAEYEAEAQRIARDYALLFALIDNDGKRLYRVMLANDGKLELSTQRLFLVRFVESRIPVTEVTAIRQRLAAAPPPTGHGHGYADLPPRGKDVEFVVPVHGQLSEISGRLGDVPAAIFLMPLIDDLAITDRASAIRLEVVSKDWMRDRRYATWPAEDLLPFQLLEKRTLTPKEWRAVATRLAEHDRESHDGSPSHDGRPFRYRPFLRVIALP
jgi:hypothetical protein